MGTAPNGYQTPKTNWAVGQIPTATDFNRIEGNIQAIEEGQRTIDPAQAPSGNSGTLRQILDWLANRIKTILGTANWYDSPPTTLQAAKNHIDAAAPHSGHETPAGAQAKVDTHAGSKQTHGISSGYYIAKTSRSDQLPAWNDIQGKPATFTPASHTHSGSDITSAVADADTVDGKHASDFMSATKVYGIVTYNDSIAANGTLQKAIALGGSYKNGVLYIRNTDYTTGSIIWFGTNPSKAIAFEDLPTSRIVMKIREVSTRDLVGGHSVGNDAISVLDVYISGNNLIIVFKNNNSATAQSLKCTVHWEVW